jgi:hypothetical protein
VRIVLRADSGFCREELMRWCEDNSVDYVFGLARNDRLRHAQSQKKPNHPEQNPPESQPETLPARRNRPQQP